MQQPKVLIFDSGVGGLSIYEEMRRDYPTWELSYVCDNAAFPYGTKSEDFLVGRVTAVVTAAVKATAAELVVVACNTASTLTLPQLRAALTIPVVGVVPAIKPAAALSRSKVIGLLATPATVRRPYTDRLIADFAADCRVLRIGSSDLVALAEAKIRGGVVPDADIARELAPFAADPALDVIVLGCTHFPLLRAELQSALPRIAHWLDSAAAISRQAGKLLEHRSTTSSPNQGPAAAYVTELTAGGAVLATALRAQGFGDVLHLSLPRAVKAP